MTTRQDFEQWIQKYSRQIENIRQSSHQLHASVNQFYDGDKPYGFHLDLVANGVHEFGHLVCRVEHDVLPLFMGAYYHDSIEDARMTYNDVRKEALRLGLDVEQALMAAEMVYALTNEKGRTRSERADERYYQGIRKTPYAPFLKMCDRLANYRYSARDANEANRHMLEVYRQEMPHFLKSILVESDDIRFRVPMEMTSCLEPNI